MFTLLSIFVFSVFYLCILFWNFVLFNEFLPFKSWILSIILSKCRWIVVCQALELFIEDILNIIFSLFNICQILSNFILSPSWVCATHLHVFSVITSLYVFVLRFLEENLVSLTFLCKKVLLLEEAARNWICWDLK